VLAQEVSAAADWAVMTSVRASCPGCGSIEIAASEITVRCCDQSGHDSYRLRCPMCSMWMVKDANAEVVIALLGAGSPIERWRLPLEMNERPKGAAVIGDDDLIDFHEALARLPTAVR